MLLATCCRVPNASEFLDGLIEALPAAADWELDHSAWAGLDRWIHAKYVGNEFPGEGLMLSVSGGEKDPTLIRVALRAEEWPTHVCWDDQFRPERLAQPLFAAAMKACRHGLKVVLPPADAPPLTRSRRSKKQGTGAARKRPAMSKPEV